LSDLKITELQALAGADLAATDALAVADLSASETKKITVADLIAYGADLISNAEIPSAKISFAAGSIVAASLASDSVTTAKIAADAVTAAKLADQSSCIVAADLAALQAVTGDFIGQLGLAIDTTKIYLWRNSTWNAVKAAGSINTISADTSGIVNITVSTSGDTATVGTSLDNTGAAGQFLAGPTGSAGAVSYRTIAGADLPTATTSAKGGVIINGGGLTMSGDTAVINNTVTPVTDALRKISYNAQGLITASTAVAGTDLPLATSVLTGAMRPGTGLSVNGSGVLNHANSVAGATQNGITFDAQGHITSATALVAADIPEIPASKITSGTLAVNLIGTNAITGAKLANYSTVKFGGAGSTAGVVTFPTPDFNGQQFFDTTNGDLYLFDGNAWQPITVISGDLVYAGAYNANTNRVISVTTQGSAAGFVVGSALPAASASNLRYYVVVSDSGTGVAPAPSVALAPPDMLVSNGATYDHIDVSNAIAGQTASNISVIPYGNIAATNAQTAIQELDDEKLAKAGGVVTGELLIGTTGTFGFEGSTANAYETYLAVVDPTADRTITFPDATGTVVLSGAIVNADINASAAIAYSKLSLTGSIVNADINASAAITYGKLSLTGSIVNADVNASAAIAYSKLSLTGSIVNADIGASAAIADTKLATISTAGKVSNSATTATNANTASAIVARDASGNFSAGTISAALTGNASTATALATARNIQGVAFDGTAAITVVTAGSGISVAGTAVTNTGVLSVNGNTGAITNVAVTNTAQSFTAAQRGTISALGALSAGTTTLDFATANNFSFSLPAGGTVTLATPSNITAGQSGCIVITQNSGTAATVAYSTAWKWKGGAPSVSTTLSSVNVIAYFVESTSRITAQLLDNTVT
jgi:hypothetical protein